MAGSSSASSSDVPKLECPVCHRQFTDPKILHCLHSFCKSCIVCLHESDGPMKGVVCPLCCRETKFDCIDKLRSSSHLMEKLKDVRVQEEVMKSPKMKLTCGSCNVKSRKAAARCLDCSMYLCLSCKMVHRRIAALSQHRVVSLDDLRSGKGIKTPRKETAHDECSKHPGEKLKFFCQTCKEWVCRDCRVAKHGGRKPSNGRFCDKHEVVDSDLINSEWRSWTKIGTANLEKAVTQFQTTLDTITKAGPEFKNHAAVLVEDVKEFANTIREVIETEEARLIKEIGRIRQEQKETLQGCTRKVKSAIQEMKHVIETANDVADLPSDQDFSRLQPIIKNELSRLIKRKPSELYNGLPLMRVEKRRSTLRLGRVEMSFNVTLPPPERRAKQDPATLVDTSETSVPANPRRSSETSVPANPRRSSETSVPANPRCSSETSVPANPRRSSETLVPTNPRGSSETSVPANPRRSSETSVPANPRRSSETSVPANPRGSSETSVPANPRRSSETSVPANPRRSSETSVPVNPRRSSETSVSANLGGFLEISVPANHGISSETSVPATHGISSETSVSATPGGMAVKTEMDPDLPGAKRKQTASEEASEQGDESRNVKRCKTEL